MFSWVTNQHQVSTRDCMMSDEMGLMVTKGEELHQPDLYFFSFQQQQQQQKKEKKRKREQKRRRTRITI